MNHSDQTTFSGDVTEVFAHRFVVKTENGTVLADLGPAGAAQVKLHKGDHHTRRGLMKIIGQRRRLLDYVRDNDVERYRSIIGRLGIRR